MDIQVRLASAQDRTSLEEFYTREGIEFSKLLARNVMQVVGTSKETMYVIAATMDIVVAALKLDVVQDPSIGLVGFIQHFEIEDELESTDLGQKMLSKAAEIADDKGLRALNAIIRESRTDMIKLFTDSSFKELRKEVYLRRSFRPQIFTGE
ncbi:MAG: hypothetical protein RTU30_14340 [Candidatus Thorarchaeota archaeon]